MSEAKTLYQKLLAVQKAVNYLQAVKEGHQYKYVGSSDVLAPIRNAMDEQGLLLFAEVLEHATEEGNQRFTELVVKFTWVNADKPDEREEFLWYGQGLDTGEKGVGKALTYAEKYFMLKFFHIATDKDDPDRFQQERGNGQQHEPAPPPEPAGPPEGLFDADGVPQNYHAVSYRLATLGISDKERRKELVADAAAIVLGEDAKPQTPADWYQVMQAAEDIALEEAEKAAQEAYA